MSTSSGDSDDLESPGMNAVSEIRLLKVELP